MLGCIAPGQHLHLRSGPAFWLGVHGGPAASSAQTWASSRPPGSPLLRGNAGRTATALVSPPYLECGHETEQKEDRCPLLVCCHSARMSLLDRTTGLVQKNGGHQELPGVVEKGFLYQVVGRARRRPLPENLPPGRAEDCGHQTWTFDLINVLLWLMSQYS